MKIQKLLKFIMDKELKSIDDFPQLLQPLKENFNIQNHNGEEATEELLNTIVWWETHTEINESLEELINKKFVLQ